MAELFETGDMNSTRCREDVLRVVVVDDSGSIGTGQDHIERDPYCSECVSGLVKPWQTIIVLR